MSRTAAEILEEARRLKEEERSWLIDSLLGEEPDTSSEVLEAAWGEEIQQRMDDLDSGRIQTTPLEDVLARMDERLQSRREA